MSSLTLHILRLSPACSAASRYFHLHPCYEHHYMVMNVFLDTVNINAINISTLVIRIWQHFSRNWIQPHLQQSANIPEVPFTQLYRGMINNSESIHWFTIKDNKDPSLIWTILKHPQTYIGTISMIFVLCIGVYCLKIWIRAASPMCIPYSPVSLWHVIVDDDVEVAPIYRCGGKAWKPIRPCRNHDLHIEWEAERLESHWNNLLWQKEFLYPDHWALKPK